MIPESSILDTAVAAHTAGLCPIRAATDGSKRPLGNWKQYQSERPGLDDVMVGFAHSENIGLVLGAVSDRLVCFDFEGRAATRWNEIKTELRKAGVFELFDTWFGGYTERTPSGGLHIFVHYGGDGPVPGNTKIALDADRNTVIETRGEGGFVIIAPSNGSTHPSGGRWEMVCGDFESICWATPEEYDAVVAALGHLDETAPPSPPLLPRPRLTVVDGPGWIDEAKAALEPVEVVLARWGWAQVSIDSHGQLWRRPGKDTGHSARVNEAGRLLVFSSSTPFPLPPQSMDAADVELAHRFNRMPTTDERTEYLRQFRRGMPVLMAGASAAKAGAFPSEWLPPEFWSARPIFQAIHDGALLRMLSPEGVLGAFLSCYATTVPMSIVVPPIVVGTSPLNTYCALVAKSGGGKTGAMRAALELLGWNANTNPHVLLDVGLRSGEGLITAANRPKTKDDPDPGYRNGVQISFDEGGVLSRQAERSGATVLPYLNTAWAGAGTVGGYKASESGSFPASLVRVCAVMGVQYGAAANLFTGEAEKLGFPQRLLFFGLSNPVLRTVQPSASKVRDLEPVDVQFWSHGEFAGRKLALRFPDPVMEDVQRWTLAKTVDGLDEPLDGHRMLLIARTAGLFALMEGRGVVSMEDWDLADQMCATSRAVRSGLLRSLGDVVRERNRAQGVAEVERADAANAYWLDQRADRIARHLQNHSEGLTLKQIKAKLASHERPRRDEILGHAEARGIIVQRDGRYHAR